MVHFGGFSFNPEAVAFPGSAHFVKMHPPSLGSGCSEGVIWYSTAVQGKPSRLHQIARNAPWTDSGACNRVSVQCKPSLSPVWGVHGKKWKCNPEAVARNTLRRAFEYDLVQCSSPQCGQIGYCKKCTLRFGSPQFANAHLQRCIMMFIVLMVKITGHCCLEQHVFQDRKSVV